MIKLKFFYIILLFVEVLLTIWIGSFTSTQLYIISVAWFLIGSYFIIFNLVDISHLSQFITLLFLFTFLPLLSLVKINYEYSLIPGSYYFLNPVEHFYTSFLLTIFTFLVVRREAIKMNLFMQFLLIIGIINTLGIVNEVVEYIIRARFNYFREDFYSDTMQDLVINFLGAVIAIGIIFLIDKIKARKRTSQSQITNH